MTKQKLIMKQKQKKKEKDKDKLKTNYNAYKQELDNISKKYNDLLSAEIILKEAKQTQSPLHDWFDWEDSEAGEKWRLHQARMLINSVRVEIKFDKGVGTYRKYLNVNIQTSTFGKPQRFYVSTKKVLKNKDLREQILKRAISEVEYWEREYRQYNELNDIFKGIKVTKRKIKKILS